MPRRQLIASLLYLANQFRPDTIFAAKIQSKNAYQAGDLDECRSGSVIFLQMGQFVDAKVSSFIDDGSGFSLFYIIVVFMPLS